MTVAPTSFQHRRRVPLGLLAALAAVAALAGLAIYLLVGAIDSTESSSPPTLVGSGTASTDIRIVPAFDRVELSGSNLVIVRVGGAQHVVVHGDDNLLQHVTTRVVARNLVIGTSGSFSTSAPMRVDVSVPTLTTLALTGSGIVRATGTVPSLDVSLRGSGDLQLGGLAAQDVRATLTGSGRIVVTATRTLVASIPGSGTIVYGGHPSHVRTTVTGSGAVVAG